MYAAQVVLAAYWGWWDAKVSANPKRWERALFAVAAIMTFLPAVFGTWAFAFYPIGWIFVLPGLIIASKKSRRADEIKADRIAKTNRTKMLISLGQKEKTQ